VTEENKANGHGLALDFTAALTADAPAPQFNGAEILDAVLKFVRRYVHLSDQQAAIVAVWIAHTHGVTAATATPYLAITSATKQCGKTRLLEVLELLVNKPWLTGRATAACLVRKVDQVRPTLLLDESDAAFNGEKEYAEALRGILNTGFYVGGVASCCVGQGANIGVKDFRTYCPKAIAGIGQLPDTVADRSIPIRLERKNSGEVVGRFRRRFAKGEGAEIKSAVANWITATVDRLKDTVPSLPENLTDRQQDAIEPLLAIADEAGGLWPENVRNAAVEIFHSQAADDQNIGVQLLTDLRAIFQSTATDKMSTVELLEKLKEIETSPWADWSKGKGLTPNGLSRLLKPFGITPRTIRIELATPKGYLFESFDDAFSRYLTPCGARSDFVAATPPQPASLLAETHISNRNTKPDVAVCKSASNPHEQGTVAAVAAAKSLREGVATKEGVERTLPSCPVCGSFALYREKDGTATCQTCPGD
jgi:uncharacterized protein DUF3631